MSFMQIVLSPFVWILTAFYNLTGSYGLALLLFAVVVKVILFPLSLKGKRSMIQMNMLSGEMQRLQKRYGRDRERYNMEVQKLYEREKVNPMGGCLWSFLPLLILLPLYAIIRRPLFYIMGLDVDQIAQVAQSLNWSSVALDMGWIKSAAEFTSGGYNELFLSSLINENNITALRDISANILPLNFNFLGLDLSQVPQLKFWLVAGGFGLFLMPIISAVTGFLFSLISMRTNAVNRQAAQGAQAGTNKVMLVISPIISLWIGFSMPAGMCLYWIGNNLLSMLQEVICGRLLKKDYERAAARRAEQERLAKEEEKAEKQRKAEERARRIEEEKLNRGKKKKTEKKKEDDGKIPAAVKEASRVGMRQYARGRAYDPNRYSQEGPTAYPGQEPVSPPQSDSRALKHETHEMEEELREIHTDEAIEDSILAAEAADKPAQETAAEEPPAAEETPAPPAEEEAEAPYAPEAEEDSDKDKKE